MLQYTVMLKIIDAVRETLSSSEIALTALSEGYLNLSAYAETICKDIEEKTKKPVRTGTIVVALSRLTPGIRKQAPLLPHVAFENISVKSGLLEIAFDKTGESRKKLKSFYDDPIFAQADFFTITQGVGETSIIAPQELKSRILKILGPQKPKLLLENLASLTIKIDGKHINIPNTFYAIMRHLAVRRINIVEAVSTYTELTFILNAKDLEEAFILFNRIFQKKR